MSDSRPSSPATLRFGGFVLDGDRQQLLRQGDEVALSPKAFRVLELLARHPDEVITKDRLLDEVWADVHVLEGVVKVCIAEIRKALGETGARPRHLHTVQRRGYRFQVAAPEAADAEPEAPGASTCPSCGTEAAPGAGFCSTCGARLASGAANAEAPASPARAAQAPRAELRQLTVVSCQGFETAGGESSAETAKLRDACRATCEAIARSLGGRAASDEDETQLLVYFGHPRSREDDGPRAVRAAMRMLVRLPAINARLGQAEGAEAIALRIALRTGPVAVAGEHTAPVLGTTADEAVELARQTPPGTVAVCAATRSLLREAFEVEPLAQASGEASSLPAFRVLQPRTEAGGRVDAAEATRGLPIIGRDQEVGLLLDRWSKVREGQGQTVLVSGEAGIGKSRLVQVLRERIDPDDFEWVELYGSAYHQNSALHPVIELLRRTFRFAPEDEPEEQVVRLEMGLEQAGLPVGDMLPFFTDLLTLPLLRDEESMQLSQELQRARTLEAICAWLFGLADQHPLVVFAEDLHWADPSTIELLGQLIEHGQWYPILVVATFRPEFVPPWTSTNALVLPLDPLGQKEVQALVAQVAGGKSVPRIVREHVVAKGDGIPLFVEELTRSLLESELLAESDERWERVDPLPGWSVPSTLQDSLEARLDRLGPAKELLQLAAVIGREFSHAELEAIARLEPDALEASLRELMAAGLVYRRGVAPRIGYTFKHALIQDIAYRSLLPETRVETHQRIADVLEERFAERIRTEPEAIARHYEEGGQTIRAIEAYERAGERAALRSADREAVAHYRKALDLLARMPAGEARDRREIALQVAIGTPLAASRGFGNPEVQAAYGRARELLDEVGDDPRRGEVLDGLVSFYITQSQLDDAIALVDQQLELAQREQDAERLLSAHYCLGIIHYFRGDPRTALEHLGDVDALYDPEAHRDLLSIRGENVGVAVAIWSAWALWIRGYPDRAVQACRDAVERAVEAGHLFSLAYAHAWASVIRWNRRERPEAIEHSEAAIEIAEEHGFPIPLGVARLVWLRCRPEGAMTEADLRDFEQALAELAATGTQAAVPQILAGIGEYCLERDRPEWAPGYVDGALAVSAATGQPHWDAEALRAKAALVRAQKPDALDEVGALYRRALDLAKDQHAHGLELRAAIDLAQLLADQDREAEAVEILAPVASWFDEDATAPDVLIGRALLAELGG